jgi:hypothetical protein
VPGFPGMLLLKHAPKVGCSQYSVCKHCKTTLNPSYAASMKPPKYAISNSFAIGSFPDKIPYSCPDKLGEFPRIDMMNDVYEVMKALIAPVCPFGYVF